ncbi:hypothetical protein VIOR103205_02005 [Vibrio ordalii]
MGAVAVAVVAWFIFSPLTFMMLFGLLLNLSAIVEDDYFIYMTVPFLLIVSNNLVLNAVFLSVQIILIIDF